MTTSSSFPPALPARLAPRCRSPSPRSGSAALPSLPGALPPGRPEERTGRGLAAAPRAALAALRPAAPAQPQRSAHHGHRCRRPRAPQETLCSLRPARPAGACPAICLYSHSRRQRRGGAAGAPAAAPRPHRPPGRRGGAGASRRRSAPALPCPARPSSVCARGPGPLAEPVPAPLATRPPGSRRLLRPLPGPSFSSFLKIFAPNTRKALPRAPRWALLDLFLTRQISLGSCQPAPCFYSHFCFSLVLGAHCNLRFLLAKSLSELQVYEALRGR